MASKRKDINIGQSFGAFAYSVNLTAYDSPVSISMTVDPQTFDQPGAEFKLTGSNDPASDDQSRHEYGSVTLANVTDLVSIDVGQVSHNFLFVEYVPGSEATGAASATVIRK